MSDSSDKTYGFTALPADQSQDKPRTTNPEAVAISSLQPPNTPLATRVDGYVKSKLDADTYRHSLRVYSYGCAIARQCFPEFELTPGSKLDETWFLTAMLHDIGTCDEFMTSTRLSYEFFAGVHAFDLLQNPKISGGGEGVAPREQAESVVEAIIRHQDVQDKGKVTLVTRLIHWGTLLDNIGAGKELVHPDTIKNVVTKYPRPGWSGCFKRTVEKEKKYKPYAMVSRIEGFEELIAKNGASGGLMAKYD
ncbi:uncharacterized protein Z520_08899 [Fonsecaea multimorphosa CBS 102226]|uniref:HD/PDEase domain-containing protein n=1 Tax=Fonsecaea multimorphosa CBS 102226 TaxID=1442371 RepID=A0A0D2JPV2_9EURO|nr:uncharacterized protein Z520_08899 [Fonsecaea multimorphosa CBS 102226]KIX95382.1 hypothetical protein Z520_08899 [Fonsecaea multimorphosa CBS 102226]OAL21050.1 hypothetical protein AYO22_08334 [Fonsecaea multimorphosa]